MIITKVEELKYMKLPVTLYFDGKPKSIEVFAIDWKYQAIAYSDNYDILCLNSFSMFITRYGRLNTEKPKVVRKISRYIIQHLCSGYTIETNTYYTENGESDKSKYISDYFNDKSNYKLISKVGEELDCPWDE